MPSLRTLSLAAMIDAFGTVLLGSWTRINGAGMTCPDWPTCHGQLIPLLNGGTLWEWTHRLWAFLLVPLVIAVVVQAWRLSFDPSTPLRYAQDDKGLSAPQDDKAGRLIIQTAGVIAALFIVQVLLGALTVRLSNSPISVVLHWGTAMALIAALAAMAIFASETSFASQPISTSCHPERSAQRAVEGEHSGSRTPTNLTPVFLFASALIAFVTMCVGAYVSSSGAGLACLSIPECAGNVVVLSQGQFVQMLHRFLAAATLLASTTAFALVWLRIHSLRTRIATSIGLALVFVQVLLGLLNVALRLPMDLREAHAANAALVFLAFIVATLFAAIDTQTDAQFGTHAVPAK